MEDSGISFGLWLKHRRRALDLTQEELAQQIGCAPGTLRKIEAGERRPSKQILERLAAILALPPAEQPAFMAYGRAVFPDQAAPLPDLVAAAPERAPWQAPERQIPTHNLPIQLTSFIGREPEIAEVKALLAGRRLLTLTGAGGAGKTRLALQVASGLLSDFRDGVWWVELARLSDAGALPQAVTAALRLRAEAPRPLLDQLADYLCGRQLLLLLDNCEHLIGACANFADTFLRVTPQLKILATSRESLAIAGETTYRVPSLQVPGPGHLPALPGLVETESVQLFVQRGAAVLPGFRITEANGPSVAEICRSLGGIPLAIELAAARVNVLPVEEIRVRLHDRFALLTGGSRLALPRHQTLRATLDWSYGLLSGSESVLLRRLAVFAGGWTLDAAEAVCGPEGLAGEVLDALAGLVDKSLVVPGLHGRAGRYDMLETMRQYALERLAESGEQAGLQEQHAGYFLALAELAEPRLFSPEQNAWLARLEDEHANLLLALAHLRDQRDPQPGLRLAGALWRFWEVRGHLAEGQAWLTEMLRRAASPAGPETAPGRDAARARGLLGAGVCAYYQRDFPAVTAQLAESLSLYRVLGDRQGMARAVFYHGWMKNDLGAFAEARALFEESAALCREIGDRQGLGWALARLGLVSYWEGDSAAARPLLEQGLALSRELNDKLGTAWWLEMMALTLCDLEEYNLAQAIGEEGALRCRELGDRRDLSGTLMALGMAELERGRQEAAHLYFREALVLTDDLGDKMMRAAALSTFAVLGVAQLRPAQGLRFGSASSAAAEAAGIMFPKGWLMWIDRVMRVARQALGPAAAEAAWTEGRTLPLDQVVAEALSSHDVPHV